MKKEERIKNIIEYFLSTNPRPQTELNYNSSFELLVAVILSAQCTDKRVNLVTPKLFEKFATPYQLANATHDLVFLLIKSISYPNSKAKYLIEMSKTLTEKYHGKIPSERIALETLEGVGRKTANVILSVVFNEPTIPVDTHVARVSKRTGIVSQKAKTPLAIEKELLKNISQKYVSKSHHWLILHGRYVCKAQKPLCLDCGIAPFCKKFHKN